MKKWICFLLSILMTLTLLTACDGKPSASGPQEIPGPTTPDGRPILKVGVSAGELSEEEYQFFEGLGEQLGYEIEIICRPQGVLAADDYWYNKAVREGEPLPDIILNLKTNFATNKALAERMLDITPYLANMTLSKPLHDYLATLSVYEQEFFTNYIKFEEAGVSGLPFSNDVVAYGMEYTPWINQEWLDRLDLEMPTDKDELLEVLRIFFDADLDDDTYKDTPAMGQKGKLGGNIYAWLINMYDEELCIAMDDDKVAAGKQFPTSEKRFRFTEAQDWVDSLHDEGLYTFAKKEVGYNNYRQSFINNEVGIYCGNISVIPDEVVDDWVPMPVIANAYIADMKDQEEIYRNYITTDCENPDAAWKFLVAYMTSGVLKRVNSSYLTTVCELDVDLQAKLDKRAQSYAYYFEAYARTKEKGVLPPDVSH